MKIYEHLDDIKGDIDEKIICYSNNIRKKKLKSTKLKILTIFFSFLVTFLSGANFTYVGLREPIINILIALFSAVIPALIAYEGLIADSQSIKRQSKTLNRLTDLKHDINLWDMEQMDESKIDINKVNQIQKKLDDIIKKELD